MKEAYRKCNKTLLNKRINICIKFEMQIILIKEEINIILLNFPYLLLKLSNFS